MKNGAMRMDTWMDGWIPECMNGGGWDGMDIQMNGWLNHQKQKPRMVGSVQWQAGKNACHMVMGKEKDRKKN